MKNYDLLVIGGGAGISVADAAMQNNIKCALIEKSKLGGTCLTKGCIPSKILVYVADLRRELEHAAITGFKIEGQSIDWDTVSKRVWNKINQSALIEKKLEKTPLLDLYKGCAHFVDKNTVTVEYDDDRASELIQADKIIIAAGARSFIPPIEGLEDVGYITAESFFGDKYPVKPWKTLNIIGAGAIGLEFAHIFSALGTKVNLIEVKDRIAYQEEPEISDLLHKQLEKNGVSIFTSCEIKNISQDAKGKIINIKNKHGNFSEIVGDELLIASGLRSNSDFLHLENTDIETDAKGWIKTDEFLQTTQDRVWALGDINGKYQFRHKANYEVEVLVHNLFGKQTEKRQAYYNNVPWAIFTYPQVAHVGLTQEQAIQAGHKVLVGKNPYSAVASGYAMGYERNDEDGFVKLITDENYKILGVHIIGSHAAILIQPYVYLMNAGAGCQEQETDMPHGQVVDGQIFDTNKRLRPGLCPDANTTAAIDQSMIIHPALSEVAGWVTGELEPT